MGHISSHSEWTLCHFSLVFDTHFGLRGFGETGCKRLFEALLSIVCVKQSGAKKNSGQTVSQGERGAFRKNKTQDPPFVAAGRC